MNYKKEKKKKNLKNFMEAKCNKGSYNKMNYQTLHQKDLTIGRGVAQANRAGIMLIANFPIS